MDKGYFHSGKQKRWKYSHSGILPSCLECFLRCKHKGMVGWPSSSQQWVNLNPSLLDIQCVPLLMKFKHEG